MTTIAQISDLHVGSPFFVPNLMNRVIVELNELEPDVVVCTGDLTNEGYRQEYKNVVAYFDRIKAPIVTVPGNHDARNVGYLHFEELIGPRHWVHDVRGIRIVGADSSEPDLNEGQIGRERYDWIREQFAQPADLKVFALHHHLIPVPGTGRERSTVMDAGDLLELLVELGVQVVLSGHKHVPYVWRLEHMYITNAGTASSLRLRGHTRPCYNVVEVEGDEVKIQRKFPFGGQTVLAHFSPSSGQQYHRHLESLMQNGGRAPIGAEAD
ncbi:MAG TPA: metallophosphoesterase [Actinomycetota bacterium]|nr:metallophosphoesterase [Actinomycetota bacterium]